MMANAIRCTGHERSVADLCYSPDGCDGSLLLSASFDSRAILRDGGNGDWLRTFASPDDTSPVASCSLTTAPALRAATASHGNGKIWDVVTGRLLHKIKSRDVQCCAFSMNGHHLLTGGCNNTVRIFDLNNIDSKPEIFCESDKFPEGPVYTASWLQNDQIILACNFLQGVRLWDRRSGNLIHILETEGPVRSSEVNHGHITLAAGSTVTILDEYKFCILAHCKIPCKVESVSLYGERCIAGGADGLVYLFDFATGRKIGQYEMRGFGAVSCVRFSLDGKSYASGFRDGTVIIKKL